MSYREDAVENAVKVLSDFVNATEDWQCDLRNEFTVEKSKEIMKLFIGSGVPSI